MIKSHSISSERILNNRGKQPYFKFVPSFIFYLKFAEKNEIEKEREGGKRARRRELAKTEIFGMLTRNWAVSRARAHS